MKKSLIFIVFLLLSNAFFARTYTQFSHYSVKEGLSEINVLCMLQDKKGQMWFGTFDGLNMFNGYTFKTYKSNPGQLFGLENYRVDFIKEDNDGYLWVQTYDGRVYRFDPKTENFLQVPQCIPEFKNYKLPIKSVFTLKDGSVWLSSDEDGCFKVENLDTDEKIKLSHFNINNDLLTSNKVNKVFLDEKKNTWILTANGLNLLKKNSTKTSQLFKEKGVGNFISILEMSSIIWMGGEHGILRIYNSNKETFDAIKTPISSNIIDIYRINANEIFLLTDKSGFFIYNLKTLEFSAYNKLNNSGVKNDIFYSGYMDKKHNIWLESDNPSIVYFETAKRKVNNFNTQVDNFAPFSRLPNFFVIEDKSGNTWVNPRFGGFAKYNSELNTLEPFYNDPNSKDRKFSNVMHSAYSDSQGNLWLCPYSYGIEKIVFSQSPFNFYKPSPNETNSASNEVRSLFQDKDNLLWVGKKNGTIHIYDTNRKLIGELGANGKMNSTSPLRASIYSITSDKSGAIWLGSKGDGLFKLTKKGGGQNITFSIENYKYNPDDIYSISSNNIYSVFEDHAQRMWVATYGGGINLMDTDNKQVRFISFRINLKNYPIRQCHRTRYITEDA
jgi:ligand-binding sensor domain-containing protein